MADFVITSQQPWDLKLGSNARDIARELAKRGHRVLFVSTPLDLLSLLRGGKEASFRRRKAVLFGKEEPLREINQNLWVIDIPHLLLPVGKLSGRLFDRINRRNSTCIARYVNKTLAHLGWKRPYLFIDNDIFRSFHLPEFIETAQTIYYRRDNLKEIAYWQPNGARLEPILAAKCDMVTANSALLATEMLPYNPHSYDIGQGVDLSAFQSNLQYPIPFDVEEIPFPIIGYAGFLTAIRLDLVLLERLAKSRPNYSFLFVGPQDRAFEDSILHKLPNCYFLGNKPMEEIPAYIANFDICINPQLNNNTTAANYPRKVDEYLALGKPVVATYTHTMELFLPEVVLCSNIDQYILQLDRIVSLQEREIKEPESVVSARIALAHSHSWEQCVAKLLSHLSPAT